MDLEKELRQAMAEHVAEAAAPTSLVAGVHRRHRRRVTRIRTTVGVAAVAVVAFTALPAAQFFDIGAAAPVGAPSPAKSDARATPRQAPPAPLVSGSPGSQTASRPPSTGATVKPPATPPRRQGEAPGSIIEPVRDWLTYLPAGLRPAGPCRDERSADRRTTICRWSGTPGTVEVRLVRDAGITRIEDFPAVSPVQKYTSVHGRRAISAESTLTGVAGSLVMWIDRPGTGVYVSVSASLRTQLMRIAEGVRPPS